MTLESNPHRASDYLYHILGVISTHQPVMRSDLYQLAGLDIKRDSMAYILRVLRGKGLIKCADRDGPVWLTVRGSSIIDDNIW